jgi:membrane-bound lytic murein transglycosylase A
MPGGRLTAAVILALFAALATTPRDAAANGAEILSFDDLEGWADEDFATAFEAFNQTCPDLRQEDWAAVCAFATSRPEPRRFFELFFRPVRIGRGESALFTGYYEPELRASPVRTALFKHPVFRLPPEVGSDTPWLTRAEIVEGEVLAERELEIAWLRDPVDLYYLQLQGSGRLRMTDGRLLRLGYAGQNGHPRRSIGAELVRRGVFEAHQVSSAVIRNWVRRNPESGHDLLNHDPSYVFFRVLERHPAEAGPLGAMNRPLVAGRSLAVDPAFTPLGAPVWIETEGQSPLRRLMVAHDTGGAIKGPQRADIFFGTGPEAGELASVVRDRGRMVVLLPIEQAFALALGG